MCGPSERSAPRIPVTRPARGQPFLRDPSRRALLAFGLAAAWLWPSPGDPARADPAVAPAAVSARGRLEPKNGLMPVAGPSEPVVVVSKLLVDKGDHVKAGQVLAVLDQLELREAAVDRARAELANAEAELRRNAELRKGDVISESRQEAIDLRVQLARAALREAQVALERMRVRSPIDGQVIQVYARDGERVGPDGIVELGRTQDMYAIAEVYETDIGRVRLGQRATVTSRALPRTLEGTVDRIGLKIAKLDALGTDPAARTDARVVEVEIRLDEGAAVAGLTNLQVDIVIHP